MAYIDRVRLNHQTFLREKHNLIVKFMDWRAKLDKRSTKAYSGKFFDRQVCSASSLLKLNIDNKKLYFLSSFVFCFEFKKHATESFSTTSG